MPLTEALKWADQIEAHADRVNPLSVSAATPTPPEPTMKDDKRLMGRRGPHRPRPGVTISPSAAELAHIERGSQRTLVDDR